MRDWEWPLCTPVASPISSSMALFTLALELNVSQEHRTNRVSGVDGNHQQAGLTPPFEIATRKGEEGKEVENWSLGSRTFIVMMIVQSFLERQEAVPSRAAVP